MLNPNEAPEGYAAVASRNCADCAFVWTCCPDIGCHDYDRSDKTEVKFVKVTETPEERIAKLEAEIAKVKEETPEERIAKLEAEIAKVKEEMKPQPGDVYTRKGIVYKVCMIGFGKLILIGPDCNRFSDNVDDIFAGRKSEFTKVIK
jgi:uncharacterized small protein (DUF1192 family)